MCSAVDDLHSPEQDNLPQSLTLIEEPLWSDVSGEQDSEVTGDCSRERVKHIMILVCYFLRTTQDTAGPVPETGACWGGGWG